VTPTFESKAKPGSNIDSLIKETVPDADLIMAYRATSVWRLNDEYKLLCFKHGHWYKYWYDASSHFLSMALREKATNDSIGRMFYDKLLTNDLLTIEDDSTYPCNGKDTVINGKKRIVIHQIFDAPEYTIWIITQKQSRFLHFYAPDLYLQYCPTDNRKQFLKIKDLFNKEW
jgi:hypothetical protein